MPNLIKIGQTVTEIWRFNGFQNGDRPPSWIFEIQTFLTMGAVKILLILHHQTKFRNKSVKPFRRYHDFCDFQDGGRRHLGFSQT